MTAYPLDLPGRPNANVASTIKNRPNCSRYDQGVMINDLAMMFGLSRTAVMATLGRLGAESRRGIVDRRIEEASALYEQGWSLAKIGRRYGVYPSTVRDALLRAGVRVRPRPGAAKC